MITVSGTGEDVCLFTGAEAGRGICAVSKVGLVRKCADRWPAAALRRLVSQYERWREWRQHWHDPFGQRGQSLRWTGQLLYSVPTPPYPGGRRRLRLTRAFALVGKHLIYREPSGRV